MDPASPAPGGRITLAFTDIVDSTRMTTALGDAVYRDAMRGPHCRRIEDLIARHAGHKVKTIGDAYMVAFARADEALAWAADVQAALAEPPIAATDPCGKAWTVHVRIGLHTAEHELWPDRDNDYTGTDVNFAARVQSLADGQQILVSDSAYRAAGSRQRFAWKDWPHRRIKSFDRPETVWELLWDNASRGEPGKRWLPDWFVEHNSYVPRPGREAEVLSLFADPDTPEGRLVTLHGPGGMGKTRLAVACAVQAASFFADGVFFVPLSDAPRTAEAVAERIGRAIEPEGDAVRPHKLLADLRHKQMLLLLDNYESVECPAVGDFLARLIDSTHAVRLLVTGQVAVKLANTEQHVTLDEGMTPDEAMELFLQRARLNPGRRSWEPTADDRAAVREILGLVDYIPLFIELAAAWAGKRSPREIADGLRAKLLGPLTQAPPRSAGGGRPPRHHSGTACFDYSWDLLDPPAQQCFARLGLFADSFAADAVAGACGVADAQDQLDRLHDAALVRRVERDGRSRYTMLHPIRAYANERLAALPEADGIRRAFASWHGRLARANADLNEPAQRAVLLREWRNALGAAAVAGQTAHWSALAAISDGLGDFLRSWGWLSEAEQLHRTVVDAARRADDPAAESVALTDLGNVYWTRGDLNRAVETHGQCLEIDSKRGDRQGMAGAYNNRGNALVDLGRHEEAVADFDRALAIREPMVRDEGRRDLRNDLAGAYNNRGSALRELGRLEQAVADFGRALAIREPMVREEGRRDLRNELARAYNNRGVALHDLGRHEEAVADFDRALAIREPMVRDEGRRELTAELEGTLFNRAMIYAEMGRWELATEDIDRGGDLLGGVVGDGRRDLLPSFLNTVAERCRRVRQFGRPEVPARWANDAARWLADAAAAGAVSPVLRQKASEFFAAVDAQADTLRPAGLDPGAIERAKAALGPGTG